MKIILIMLICSNIFALDLRPKSDNIIYHKYYSLEYSEENEQAKWVYYKLTKDIIKSNVKCLDKFVEDKSIVTESAQLSDYKYSGYDRGHLCPAGSMSGDLYAMLESFYLSNISPQEPSFNRGIWKKLENQVRRYVDEYDSLIVITGPILKDNKGSIGKNKVTIPGFYYKIIYINNDLSYSYIMPHEKSKQSLDVFLVSIDFIEELTGIDFFYQLEDEVENKLEEFEK